MVDRVMHWANIAQSLVVRLPIKVRNVWSTLLVDELCPQKEDLPREMTDVFLDEMFGQPTLSTDERMNERIENRGVRKLNVGVHLDIVRI